MSSLEKVVDDVYRALQSSNWDRVLELLDAVPELDRPLPHVTFLAGQTVFHMAAEIDAPLDVLTGLIQSFGIESISTADKFGNTPLHLMTFTSNFQSLELVAQAYPPAIVAKNRRFRTPMDELFHREKNDDIDNEFEVNDFAFRSISSLLPIYPVAINEVDKVGRTLLHRCLLGSSNIATLTAIVPIILAQKKELATTRDYSGMTALHVASRLEDGGNLVELLLWNTPKLLWTAQDNQGRTALHFAIFWSSTCDVVIALTKACPEIVYIHDNEGNTPFDYFVKFHGVKFTVHDFCLDRPSCQHLARENYELLHALLVAGPHAEATNNGQLIVHAALYTPICPLVIVGFLIVGFPEKTSMTDGYGNLPIHLVAQDQSRSGDDVQTYVNVIEELCKCFPDGARRENSNGMLPLALMIEAHQPWGAVKAVLQAHPAAVHDQGLGVFETCTLLSRLDIDVCYQLLHDVPSLLEQYRTPVRYEV